MRYERYDCRECPDTREQTRFHLNRGIDVNNLPEDKRKLQLSKAVEMIKELQPLEQIENGQKAEWRIGKTTESILIVDIDNHDEKNLARVLANLHSLFNERYTTIKTLHGYQIIGTERSRADFEYKNLCVLDVDIERYHYVMQEYKEKLLSYLESFRNSGIPIKGNFNKAFEETDFCNPIGEIDYLYNILGIEKGFYTIRLTKKSKNDKWEMII